MAADNPFLPDLQSTDIVSKFKKKKFHIKKITEFTASSSFFFFNTKNIYLLFTKSCSVKNIHFRLLTVPTNTNY